MHKLDTIATANMTDIPVYYTNKVPKVQYMFVRKQAAPPQPEKGVQG